MTETFLFYIWQFQYFEKQVLTTAQGQVIEVFDQGVLNHNSGPDFSNASVRIDGLDWSGTIEIHLRSSDWKYHRHDSDKAYENVILHVVWQDDDPVIRADGTILPALILKDRVDAALVKDYDKLIHNPFSIPCTKSFPSVAPILQHSMIDRAMIQRLETKAFEVIKLLRQNNNDWEETAWQLLAGNFGFKVNGEPFLQLGKALPYRMILKHADKPIQVEALLFGQAGFLDAGAGDPYYQLLLREYSLLSSKYGMARTKLSRAQWRFLRLRPANFPTVRISQLSAIVQMRTTLFSRLLDAADTPALMKVFSARQSEYWLSHYRFNKKSTSPVPQLGSSSIQSILINSVVPLFVAWGKYNDDQERIDKAVQLLQTLPAEENLITRSWEMLGCKPKTAFDSQGLIGLYNNFCLKKNCLNCVIGASLLKPNETKNSQTLKKNA